MNLLIMNVAWASAAFTYYTVNFYVKYIPGNMYTNVMVAQFSEIIACFISGSLANRFGTKHTIIFSFAVGGIFGLTMNYVNPTNIPLILTCLLLAKFGVSSAFNMVYIITSEYFPTKYSSSVFGICNIVCRLTSAIAPLTAEIKAPYPMIIFAIFCLLSVLATSKLTKVVDLKK